MNIKREYVDEVLKLQGLEALRLGLHSRQDVDNQAHNVNTHQFWIAEISSEVFSGCVSIVHTDTTKYGIVIPTPVISSFQMNVLRIGTIKKVQLKEWDDPVVTSLTKVNLTSTKFSYTFDGDNVLVSLMIIMDGIRSDLNIDPNPQDISLRNLVMAIIHSAKIIAKTAHLPVLSLQLNRLPTPIIFE